MATEPTYIPGESLYSAVIRLGIAHDSHESDLYIEDTDLARHVLGHFKTQHENARRFTHQIHRVPWIDVPFAYDPFWERRRVAR